MFSTNFAALPIISAAMTASAHNQPDQTNNGTRDLFLSYNNRDREVVMRVRELLHQRAIRTFFDRNDLTPGMPWQSELERAINQVRAVAVLIGAEGIGAWQRPEKELALDRQVQEERAGRRFPVIPVLLPDAEANKVTGFLTRNTWIDLRGGTDNPMAAAALDALARAVTGEPPAASAQAVEPLCPYRGLEPFHEDDAPLFFGRDKFADDLLQKVLAHPLVAVVGPSGSGKSSVVQAGLLPRLRREGWPNETWEAVIFTPREHPFHSLAKELLPLYVTDKSKTERMIEARTLGEALAKEKIPLDDPIGAALKAAQTFDRLLIVVDQFEELFTLSEERYRQPFIESLIAAAARADSPVSIVLTLRADFYGQAIGLSRSLSDSIQQGLVNLGPMTDEELRQAIEGPARHIGLSFEPGLMARLLDDAKGQPGNLPLLEFALKELWQSRQGVKITNDRYDAIGRLEGAISKRADAQFERVPPAKHEAVLRAFTRLVRVSAANEQGTDTRRRVRLKDLDTAVHPVVKSFVKERLLVMSHVEETGEETVEVAHEALIRRWGHLKELLDKDREFLLWRQSLGLRLSEWQRLGRDEGALLKGALLIETKGWMRGWGEYLNELEQEFIKTSELAARRPRQLPTIAAIIVVLAVASITGWWLWIQSDAYQIRIILSESPKLMTSSDETTVHEWIGTLAASGRISEALATARRMKTDSQIEKDARYRSFVAIDETLIKLGKIEQVFVIAQEASETEERNKSGFVFVERYPSLSSRPFIAVAEALAKVGKVNEAFAAVRKIEINSQPWAFSAISEALVIAGKKDEAEKAADESLAVAIKIEKVHTGIFEPPGVFKPVAKALTRVDKIDKVLAFAQERHRPYSQVEILMAAVGELVEAEKIDEARKVGDMLISVARKVGMSEEISDTVRSLKFPPLYKSASEAKAISELISYFEEPVQNAKELASARKIDEALTVAHKVGSEDVRDHALTAIAETLVNMGDIDKALSVAREITKDTTQSRFFAELAKTQSKLKSFRSAREIADLCLLPNDKLIAYTAILREYAVKRNPSLAKLFEKEKPE